MTVREAKAIRSQGARWRHLENAELLTRERGKEQAHGGGAVVAVEIGVA